MHVDLLDARCEQTSSHFLQQGRNHKLSQKVNRIYISDVLCFWDLVGYNCNIDILHRNTEYILLTCFLVKIFNHHSTVPHNNRILLLLV